MKDNKQHYSAEPVETPQLGVFDVNGWPFSGHHAINSFSTETGMECPKCQEKRASRHLQHGKLFCWAGCGWV